MSTIPEGELEAAVAARQELGGTRETEVVEAFLARVETGIDKRIDVSLASPQHHLRGRLDEALFFADGTAGPLDYKFAKDPGRVYTTLRLQSAIYALLIRENFGVAVRRGYVVYTRSHNRVVEVSYCAEDFRRIGQAVREILA